MKTYARIEHGRVAELVSTDGDLARLYHPSLAWREVTSTAVQPGWIVTATGFAPPPAPIPTPELLPSLPQLQADLAALIARVAAFTSHTGG